MNPLSFSSGERQLGININDVICLYTEYLNVKDFKSKENYSKVPYYIANSLGVFAITKDNKESLLYICKDRNKYAEIKREVAYMNTIDSE